MSASAGNVSSSASGQPEPDSLDEALHGLHSAVAGQEAAAEFEAKQEKTSRKVKLIAILTVIALLVITGLITWGLYTLGGDDQAALERLRDIAIIYIVLLTLVTVIALVACTAVLAFLVVQLKNEAIPAINSLAQTVEQVRGTAEFMSENAARPLINSAGKVAGFRATLKTLTKKD